MVGQRGRVQAVGVSRGEREGVDRQQQLMQDTKQIAKEDLGIRCMVCWEYFRLGLWPV
jgi:hypothetical protein